MALRTPTNIIQKPSFLFAYLGAFGIIIFLLLRTSFDFNSGARINFTPEEAAQIVYDANLALGFESDSLGYLAFRYQDARLFSHLREESVGIVTPHQLNRSDIPITGWQVTLGHEYKEPGIIQGPSATFQSVGYTMVHLSNSGRIVSFRSHPARNETFIEGPPGVEAFETIIEDVFGYNASNYRPDSLPEIEADPEQATPPLLPEYDELPGSGKLDFVKVNPSLPGPLRLSITYTAAERDNVSGFRIDEFAAEFLSETVSEEQTQLVIWSVAFGLIAVVFISIVILGTAIRQIFRGRMEWKRALFIFATVTIGHLIWIQILLHPTYYQFFDSGIVMADMVQQFFLASLVGIYGAFAYVAWESLARELKSGQIPVIDSVWRGHLMKKEVGAGILTGYGIAGFYFAILAVMFISYDIVMFQNDSSSFGFREPSAWLPAGGVFLNSWLSSMLYVIAQVGLAFNLIAFVFRKESLRMLVTILIAGGTLFLIGPAFGSDGSKFQVFTIYLALSVPLVLSYRYFGIVSAIISWFVFLIGLRLLPYVGDESLFMVSQGWLLIIVLLVPFVLGLVSVIYGDTIGSAKAYLPDYEEKMNKQLRSEKELAIAKESQFALMPDTPPTVDELDVYGFFVPSHEVGGDFYDFTLLRDADGKPDHLALAIVDVSGKAMQSAFNAIFTSGLLLGRIESDSPAAVLSGINPILCRKTDDQTFITCQVGRINLKTRRMELANAGHCPPVLKRNGSASFIELKDPKFPLGFRDKITYKNSIVDLQQGDILFFYSDGFPEARSPEGKRLDFIKVLEHFRNMKTKGRTAKEISTELKDFILKFSDYELADDTTLLCVKVL